MKAQTIKISKPRLVLTKQLDWIAKDRETALIIGSMVGRKTEIWGAAYAQRIANDRG